MEGGKYLIMTITIQFFPTGWFILTKYTDIKVSEIKNTGKEMIPLGLLPKRGKSN